jgi:hypothetical protein
VTLNQKGNMGDGPGLQWKQVGPEEAKLWGDHFSTQVREANTIKQYRLISLLNVDFKIFSKLFMDRISSLVDKVISESQSAFIKGRNILEGVVTLHEIVHELSRTGR